ncbi:MAG: alanine racemase [Candidatus Nanopelagicales bacterium]|nr:alanine racemase [Candidatus Nanopelagicales bacterium]
MSFVLNVDADRWRNHVNTVASTVESVTGSPIVPVIKGNGYGLGQARLARVADSLPGTIVAVGTVFELEEVLASCLADVIVLEPFDPRDQAASNTWWNIAKRWDSNRIIRTISSMAGLESLLSGSGSVRVILEGQTSMHRFGFSESELMRVLADNTVASSINAGRLVVLGLALHLPLEQPASEPGGFGTARVREVLRWNGIWQAEISSSNLKVESSLWLSHLDDDEFSTVREFIGETVIHARIGTRVWLGDRGALTPQGSVLAVHPLSDGVHVGYRQRSGPNGGTLVVVSGGTAHGIGLSAPTPASSLRQRVVTAGTGALDAAGRALSPFTWEGKQRWFAEPPHQHHSMIWLPRGVVVPRIGDRLPADVRFTTSRFDAVLGLE